mmetsp:Transcript_10642/g.23639  ORF Transcript_10642/g.23639 Transcript_10642/m.23639 type:complete len:232 (+) Transcript_10642:346-1041(+)
MSPSFIACTKGPSDHSKRDSYLLCRSVISSQSCLDSAGIRGSKLFRSCSSLWQSFIFCRFWWRFIPSFWEASILSPTAVANFTMRATASSDKLASFTSSETKAESVRLSPEKLLETISQSLRKRTRISCAKTLLPRTGRKPPRRSEVSVVAWQFTTRSALFLKCAISCTTVVFPQPVSPTRRTGSLLSMQRRTNVNNRSKDFVGAIADPKASEVSLDIFDISCFAFEDSPK